MISFFIQALSDGTVYFGMAAGSSILGVLFSLVGTKTTLFYFSIAIAVILVLFLGYILMTEDQEYKYYIISGSEKECDMENDE